MEEFESSKEEFFKKYKQNLFEYVIPEIKKFEKERKKLFILSIFIYLFVIIFLLLICVVIIALHIPVRAVFFKSFKWLVGIIIIFLYRKINRTFEYKMKNKAVPVLVSAFDGFSWTEDANEEYYQDILESEVFPYYPKKQAEHLYNDYFCGNYAGIDIDFSQAYYNIEKFAGKFEFFGCVIRIKMNKYFEGETIVRPIKAPIDEIKEMELEKVVLEDNEFNKKFNIFSTDQIEARYLLTTAFMERLKNISSKFKGSDKIFCSFKNNNIYIAVETKKLMFSLFKLNNRVDKIEPFQEYFEQIASVIDLIDYLKLNQKTGL